MHVRRRIAVRMSVCVSVWCWMARSRWVRMLRGVPVRKAGMRMRLLMRVRMRMLLEGLEVGMLTRDWVGRVRGVRPMLRVGNGRAGRTGRRTPVLAVRSMQHLHLRRRVRYRCLCVFLLLPLCIASLQQG